VSASHTPNLDARRKRLGQYFTGDRLARLLVALSRPRRLRSAVDPMAGSGDMLTAVRDVAPGADLAGIELDAAAIEACASRFDRDGGGRPHLVKGSAFDWDTLSRLPRLAYDLVITNPPYVRYQSLAEPSGVEGIPSGEEVRRGLRDAARNLECRDEDDRKIFLSLIENYSGLSDLAVPSWILCSMLVGNGGTLSMVVPEAWLNRDYALTIHYLLLKFFRIRLVVEDEGRTWFDSAQVKTTLLVADRVPRASDIRAACEGQSYLHVTVPAAAADARSVVGNLFPNEADPDAALAETVARIDAGATPPDGLHVMRRSLSDKLSDLLVGASRSKWFACCEPNQYEGRPELSDDGARLPQALLDLLPAERNSFTTLGALGVLVGQGLRTGANDFFYADLLDDDGEVCFVAPGKSLGIKRVGVPRNVLTPVLRKQREAQQGGYVLDPTALRGRVLILDGYVHPDDLNGSGAGTGREVMPPELASYVAAAAVTNVGTDESHRFVPQLSAVRTNATKTGAREARFWYMLPPLARRHVPDLFVARVNHLHPKVMLNARDAAVIDANFSTLWVEGEGTPQALALLALFNCSWAVASMELTAAVMGGGALKLEASHLRRLPFPNLAPEQWARLTALGRELAAGGESAGALDDIDRLVSAAVFGPGAWEAGLSSLRRIKAEKLEARSRT
jgi:hypothetical protein